VTSLITFDPVKHEYRDAKDCVVPSVTQILARAGVCDFSFVEEESRIRSMQRGTSVHWMLQLQDQGALEYRRVPLRLRPYRKGYLDWRMASGFIPDWIEQPFISHYGYAGTIDRTGSFPITEQYPNGSRAVVDIKTGTVQDWVRFQLVAYAMRMHANPQVARTWRRIALALTSSGTYQVKEFPVSTWDYDWSVFMESKRRVDKGHVEHENICQF
jgi:hypothetical protein